VPVLVTDHKPVEQWVEPVAGEPLTFRTNGAGQPEDVTLVPFQRQHYERSVVYWDAFTKAEWQQQRTTYLAEQQRRRAAEARRIDEFRPGEPQSEIDHHLQGEHTETGIGTSGLKYRHAVNGWFSFEMKVPSDAPAELVFTYWGSNDHRTFDILVDGMVLATETLSQEKPNDFIHKTYALPADLTHGKAKVTVRFQAKPGDIAGGLFGCQTLTAK
jgi:hypothetical protein